MKINNEKEINLIEINFHHETSRTKIMNGANQIIFEGSYSKLRDILGYNNTIPFKNKLFFQGTGKELEEKLKKNN